MDRDVVVVGAGPSGSVAAAALARRGRDVLLLDRAAFPRDKACGDGVPPGTVAILNRLGAGPALRDAGFYSIHGLRLVSPRGRDWSVALRPRAPDTGFYVAPRLAFDDLLRRHAIASGASFRCARVQSLIVERDEVRGVNAVVDGVDTAVHARVVIGADGATSMVARSLLGERQPADQRAVAVRAYVDGIETRPGVIEFHWYTRFAPGYGWIFPTGPSSANVGVVVRADAFKRRGVALDALLDEFLCSPDVRGRARSAVVGARASWQLPYAGPGALRASFAGAVLVGDAARLVDPLTGEGIHNAVVSASLAADVVDAALSRGDVSAASLRELDVRCERELGALVRRAYRAQRRLAAHPRLLEAVFILINAANGPVTRWMNRVSTDFVVGAE